MAKKKKQHFVPQVYLNAFLDSSPPAGWEPGRPFTPGVWVQHPSLARQARRKAPSNILWENSLYTLAGDDPTAPWLEESLARLEGKYPPLVEAISNEDELSADQYTLLLVFIGALFGRGPAQLEHWQAQFDRLRDLTRQVADQPPVGWSWEDFVEIGKRSLEFRTAGYAEVVAPYGFILVNESPMPFITADQPVRHLFLHVDESPPGLFPTSLRADVPPSVEAFFSFAPLSPTRAFVASPLVSRVREMYYRTEDVELVFSMNQWMRSQAKAIISHVPRPYGDLTELVAAVEATHRPKPRSGVMLYSASARHWISAEVVGHAHGRHPLHGRLEFVAEDVNELRRACSTAELAEVRIFDSGRQVGGMRDAWISSVALSEGVVSVIENWPSGWESWCRRAPQADGT